MALEFAGPEKRVAFARTHSAGAQYVRLFLFTWAVAPGGATAPGDFNATNPGDPHYNWDEFDDVVRAAVASGLEPIVNIHGAPKWMETGLCPGQGDAACRPSSSALADFAMAAARRYSGTYLSLPRVRNWQIWNEPNLSDYLLPQSEGGRPLSPDLYRAMVNAMARAIHAIHADNVVVAGALAPFGGNINDPSGGHVPSRERIHPLEFMRKMLCVSNENKPLASCAATSEFDAWAHHPYTYGGPTHSAFHPDDVSLGDLGVMRDVLRAAEDGGYVRSRRKVEFWVTEFSYDSRPADPKGLSPGLHARWTSEALYRMWRNGVSLVTWFLLRDQPFPQEMYQSGLYFRGSSGIASDKPKPAFQAFRFPFVAFKQKDRSITFWGRTPTSSKKAVVVEQKQGAKWKRLATPAVDRYGIFQGRVTSKSSGSFRARLVSGGEASLPFSLTVPPDFRFCPWGSFC